MIDLHPLREFKSPIVAECISPDVFEGKGLAELNSLQVWEGNKRRRMDELFKIHEIKSENPSENQRITVHGNVSKVKKIGSKMKSGEIIINGDVGMHLGEKMKSGKITVRGNADGWAGSMMRGGSIEIRGNAGDYLGAPYRGTNEGMCGGKLTVHGNVGNEAGAHIKNGMIKIYGSAGQFTGLRMYNGTIYIQNNCEGRAGACMLDGKVIVGGCLESVLPTFTIDAFRPKVKIDENEVAEGPFYIFLGDLAENGRGKLYVSKAKNPHLDYCEKFL